MYLENIIHDGYIALRARETVRATETARSKHKEPLIQYTAEVKIPVGSAEGPICTMDGLDSGWSLYIKDTCFIATPLTVNKGRTYRR